MNSACITKSTSFNIVHLLTHLCTKYIKGAQHSLISLYIIGCQPVLYIHNTALPINVMYQTTYLPLCSVVISCLLTELILYILTTSLNDAFTFLLVDILPLIGSLSFGILRLIVLAEKVICKTYLR